MRVLAPVLVWLCFLPSHGMACQPPSATSLADSPERVKADFDGAQFVVTAQVADVRKVMVSDPGDSHFGNSVERATFRVEHAFKGRLKPGDTFVIDSGRSSCGTGVKNWAFIPPEPGRKAPAARAYPGRWLIYYTPPPLIPDAPVQLPPFEITHSSLSRPAELATHDLQVLKRLAGQWVRTP